MDEAFLREAGFKMLQVLSELWFALRATVEKICARSLLGCKRVLRFSSAAHMHSSGLAGPGYCNCRRREPGMWLRRALCWPPPNPALEVVNPCSVPQSKGHLPLAGSGLFGTWSPAGDAHSMQPQSSCFARGPCGLTSTMKVAVAATKTGRFRMPRSSCSTSCDQPRRRGLHAPELCIIPMCGTHWLSCISSQEEMTAQAGHKLEHSRDVSAAQNSCRVYAMKRLPRIRM